MFSAVNAEQLYVLTISGLLVPAELLIWQLVDDLDQPFTHHHYYCERHSVGDQR
jgi:hypothetical protein